MKIRKGFVSNSSSSSFILRIFEGATEEEIHTMVEKQVGKMEGFFIPEFRQQIIDTIMECKGDKNEHIKDLKWAIKWLEEDPNRSTENRDHYQAMVDDEFDYYRGGFSDNGDGPIQLWLCNTPFKVEDDGFFMENHVGY